MNTEKIARGWALIAEGAMELSLAYESLDSPVARAGDAGAEGAATPSAPALKPQVDAGLGICPIHGTRWTVKPAGVSKAGQPYEAFWKCAEKNDDDSYCKQKPQKIWRDTHPIPEGAAA